MRAHFYTLLKDLSAQMQLPFDSHLKGSRVRFQVDKTYYFGLGLDNSEQFLVFECVLMGKKIDVLESITLLHLNLAAAYRNGYFVSVDPHTDTVVLVSRVPLQGLVVTQVIETIDRMLNIADRISKGEFSQVNKGNSQQCPIFSKV